MLRDSFKKAGFKGGGAGKKGGLGRVRGVSGVMNCGLDTGGGANKDAVEKTGKGGTVVGGVTVKGGVVGDTCSLRFKSP